MKACTWRLVHECSELLFCDYQKLEIDQWTINRWMDKHTKVYPHHRILFSKNKKCTIDTHNYTLNITMQQRKTRRGQTGLTMPWPGGSGQQWGDVTLRVGAQVLIESHKIHMIWPWDPSIFIFLPCLPLPCFLDPPGYSYLRTFALPSSYSPRSKHGSDLYCLPVSFQRSPPQRGLYKSLLCLKELQTPLLSCLLLYFLVSANLHLVKTICI